jgi:hypothetical protein
MKSPKAFPFLFITIAFICFYYNAVAQLTSSQLGIMVISKDQQIPDEPKVEGKLGIKWNGDGKLTLTPTAKIS